MESRYLLLPRSPIYLFSRFLTIPLNSPCLPYPSLSFSIILGPTIIPPFPFSIHLDSSKFFYIPLYPSLSLPFPSCPSLSLSVPLCPSLSLSVPPCPSLTPLEPSLIPVCPARALPIPLHPYTLSYLFMPPIILFSGDRHLGQIGHVVFV